MIPQSRSRENELIDRIRAEVVASDISPSAMRIVIDILSRVEKDNKSSEG